MEEYRRIVIQNNQETHKVVIIGGGFGGLYCAQALKKASAHVTLVDKRNFHLFQPLLYQVATGELSPGDIASPLRTILARQKNTYVLECEVVDFDIIHKKIILKDDETSEILYDTLVLATGSSHHYFGHPEWSRDAPGLKTIEDAIEIRRRIFESFEKAEKERNPEKRRALMTFALVGGGPTGVELAGTIAELARETLYKEFRNINTKEARIIILEGTDRVLPPYPSNLSAKATSALKKLGVEVMTKSLLTNIQGDQLIIKSESRTEKLRAGVILWAAGVQASPLGKILAEKTGASLDKAGKIFVEKDLTLPNHPEIFVIGDLAHLNDKNGKQLPGVATVAIQEGEYVAKTIRRRLQGQPALPFQFKDKGNLAVIGRNKAVAEIGRLHLWGFPAWILWVFIHILYLIEFDNKVIVLFQWAWNYFTRKRGARLITSVG